MHERSVVVGTEVNSIPVFLGVIEALVVLNVFDVDAKVLVAPLLLMPKTNCMPHFVQEQSSITGKIALDVLNDSLASYRTVACVIVVTAHEADI